MQRREVLAALSALSVSAAGAVVGRAEAAAGAIDALRWKKRVVLVFAAHPDDPRLARQTGIVDSLIRQADDRDLQLVTVVAGEVAPPLGTADALRRRFQAEAPFEALLIGKDGGVKLRSIQVLSAEQLASTIDAMPMRRAERRGG